MLITGVNRARVTHPGFRYALWTCTLLASLIWKAFKLPLNCPDLRFNNPDETCCITLKSFYPHPDLIVQRAEGLGHRRRCCGLSGSGPFWFTHPVSPYLSSVSSHLTLWLLWLFEDQWRRTDRCGEREVRSLTNKVSLSHTQHLLFFSKPVSLLRAGSLSPMNAPL